MSNRMFIPLLFLEYMCGNNFSEYFLGQSIHIYETFRHWSIGLHKDTSLYVYMQNIKFVEQRRWLSACPSGRERTRVQILEPMWTKGGSDGLLQLEGEMRGLQSKLTIRTSHISELGCDVRDLPWRKKQKSNWGWLDINLRPSHACVHMCTTFAHMWAHTCKSHANTHINVTHMKGFVTCYFLSSLSHLLLLYEKWYFCVVSTCTLPPFTYVSWCCASACMFYGHVDYLMGQVPASPASLTQDSQTLPQTAAISCFGADFGNLNSGPHVYRERALSMEPFPLPWLVYVHSTRLAFFICLRYVMRIHYIHFCLFLIVHRSSKLQIQLLLRIIFPLPEWFS